MFFSFSQQVSEYYDIDESAREPLAIDIDKDLDLDDDDNASLFSPIQSNVKRPRLDINYSITPTNNSHQSSHNRRKTPHVNRLI